MRLGVVLTDEQFGQDAVNVLSAAARRGWETRCFLTDTGVKVLDDDAFRAYLDQVSDWVAVCELSVERYAHAALERPGMKDRVIVGGQYQDAELVRNTDRVLVF
ncbi:MAG: hypothetical protein PHQ14_10015 [Chromatiales bacterium]|jgi:hypothetical protein|nr:hypothetical protein [Chromatiales bacterium]MDX9766615.1 hypothetical protein [Ectothiorhodospiraceae bacterium]